LSKGFVSFARISRTNGLLAVEPIARHASNAFLQNALLFALDAKERTELQMTLEDRVRLTEPQIAPRLPRARRRAVRPCSALNRSLNSKTSTCA
jgi:hypothetical protein